MCPLGGWERVFPLDFMKTLGCRCQQLSSCHPVWRAPSCNVSHPAWGVPQHAVVKEAPLIFHSTWNFLISLLLSSVLRNESPIRVWATPTQLCSPSAQPVYCPHSVVIESGVRLLAAPKPVKRQGWWKGKFALLRRLAAKAGGRGELLSKGRLDSPPLTVSGQEFQGCIGGGRGLHAETAQSALTVILKLVMRWSDQWHLDCFKYS